MQKRGFEWLHAYCFVHPASGASEFLLFSHVDVECMQAALESFSRAANPDGRRVIVLLLDNAGWHVSKRLLVPEGLVLCRIPAYTPELNPAEGVMPLLHEGVANRLLVTLGEVQACLVERCVFLRGAREVVRGRVGFSWACL